MLAGPVLALGFGLGGIIAPLFATIVAGVTPAEIGSASGSLGAIQQLAGSIGVAALATLYAATSHAATSHAAAPRPGRHRPGHRGPARCRRRSHPLAAGPGRYIERSSR